MRMQAQSSTLPIVRLRLCDALTRLGIARAGLSCAADGVPTSHAASDAQSAHTDSDSSTVEIRANPGSTPLAGLVYCTCAPQCSLHVASSRAYCERYVARLVAEARCIGARCVSRIAVPHRHTLPLTFPPTYTTRTRRGSERQTTEQFILGYRRYAQKPVAIAGRVLRVGRRLFGRRRPRAANRFRRRRRRRAVLPHRPGQRDVGR
jgi:hypothetical protein